MFQEILLKLLQNDCQIELELDKETNTIVYCLLGFYKYGSVKLTDGGDHIIGKTRYDITYAIYSFDDIVRLNFEVWQSYKANGWDEPEYCFVEDMLRLGLIVPDNSKKYKTA